MIKWKYASGMSISCNEKIKILNENYREIEEIIKDALDDAVLIGMDEEEYKNTLNNLITSIKSDY